MGCAPIVRSGAIPGGSFMFEQVDVTCFGVNSKDLLISFSFSLYVSSWSVSRFFNSLVALCFLLRRPNAS